MDLLAEALVGVDGQMGGDGGPHDSPLPTGGAGTVLETDTAYFP